VERTPFGFDLTSEAEVRDIFSLHQRLARPVGRNQRGQPSVVSGQ